jgi:predicted transcriptional regulator
MRLPRLSKLELQIMEILWTSGTMSIREIQQAFPGKTKPAYTTVQTTVYRLESKKAVKRIKKISNAHIFAALISRDAAHHRIIDELWSLLGARTDLVMSHLINTGRVTLQDIEEAKTVLQGTAKKETKS